MRTSFLVIFIIIIPFFTTFAQPQDFCGTDQVEALLANQNPEYLTQSINLDYQLKREILTQRTRIARSEDTIVYTIPMVFHVLYEYDIDDVADSKVYQEIDNINEIFRNIGFYDETIGADARIQFCLAQLDTSGQFTSGIRHIKTFHANSGDDMALKALYHWDTHRYMNVYVATSLLGNGGVLGYAYYPTNHGRFFDGIVIRNRLVGESKEHSVVFAHEIGHYLGLPHPFNQGCRNDDCLLDGDRVCDTPPDVDTLVYEGCRVVNNCDTDADDPSPNNPFTTDVPDMNNLYMDYNSRQCQNAFTDGQVERMRIVVPVVRNSLLNSDVCRLPVVYDAGISGVLRPVITQCETELDLQIEVRNFGLVPLTGANIIIKIDQGNTTAANWSGNLSYTEKDTFDLTINSPLNPGIHDLEIYISSPNGQADQFQINDTFRTTFNYLPIVEPPLYEDFENGVTSTWTIDNPGGLGWELIGYGCDSLGNPGQSLYIDNTIPYVNGLEDRLLSPSISLKYAQQNPVLKFDIAFPYDSALNGFREQFRVTYSLDCGVSFNDAEPLFERNGRNLASTFISVDTAEGWVPAGCQDWKTYSIPLDSLIGEDVIFSFDYQKFDSGFPLYLDNIRVEGTFNTNVEELYEPVSFTVYPNPGRDLFQVMWEKSHSFAAEKLIVSNIHGQRVKSIELRGDNQLPIQVDLNGLGAGVYFFELQAGKQTAVKKVVKW
ncbi:MAG: T9SS type A sorting domain-containing protein [Bacteroidetes bacterium]|nr:T9SS type A sorting domain-containing protein [Bacteroidota bacterium]